MTATQPDSARSLLILPGGTAAADVAVLHNALADLLSPTPLPARSALSSLPLLVPAAPGEDCEALAGQVRAALPQVPAAASVILRTSGSTTGQSSLIAISAAALRASAEATFARLAGPGQWVLALPAHHVAGLQVLVRSVLAGTRPVVVEMAGGFRTSDLAAGIEEALARAHHAGVAAQAASRCANESGVSDADSTGTDPHGRTRRCRGEALPVYVSVVPTQLLRCLKDDRATAALARTTAVLVGGAATDPAVHARALAAGIPVVRTYGMSETGGGCVYDGVPLDGVEVHVADPDEGGVGRIVLAGPTLAEAVLGEGAGSSRLVVRPDGVRELVTSDCGRLEAGVLTVLGRVDDVIVTGGIKVEPRIVEETLCQLPGVEQACVVGVPDSHWGQAVVAVVVPSGVGQPAARQLGQTDESTGSGLDPEEVRRAARQRLDGAHAPKRVLVVDHLPQRGPGKVDRRAVAAFVKAESVTISDGWV